MKAKVKTKKVYQMNLIVIDHLFMMTRALNNIFVKFFMMVMVTNLKPSNSTTMNDAYMFIKLHGKPRREVNNYGRGHY